MKKTFFKTVLVLVIALLAMSCSKDEADGATPCTPIVCLNNGVSNANCGCDCPPGYGGANCGTILTPSKITISKVIVKSFNNLNTSGIGHDLTNGADIYIKINSGNTVIYDHPNIFSNATDGSNTNYVFTLNPILEIVNVNSPLVISLWDYDLGDTPSNPDDNMASAVFIPFAGNSFPSSIPVTDPSTATKFEVFFTYQW